MKLLLDQGLPRTAATLLSGMGYDTLHAGDVGLACSADTELIEYSLREHRAIVTLDSDFHAILALSGKTGPSVLRIRIEGMKGPQVADLVAGVVEQCREELQKGALVSVDTRQIRVRILPVDN